MSKIKFAVFIGRFQPLHSQHIRVIEEGLKQANKVIVLIGSSNCPRNIRNPFTYEERRKIIEETFGSHVIVRPLADHTYNNIKWIEEVRNTVLSITGPEETSISLLGCHKDNGTSYYLKMFPEWNCINIPLVYNISATYLREILFARLNDTLHLDWKDVPSEFNKNIWSYICDYVDNNQEAFKILIDEYNMVSTYKESWKSAPYPPTFVTVDAMVVQSGHVLLVKRGAMPGKGQWALPGGFINQDERIEDAILRELVEETKIKVPNAVLLGNMDTIKVFDDPNRSTRGRTITHLGLIQLPDDVKLPKIKGSDDAAKASWWKLNEVRENLMYEDHYHILRYMTGFLK